MQPLSEYDGYITNMSQKPQEPVKKHEPLPLGFRQGIITAITVLLGFSLLFLRFWNFELPGAWSASSIIATLLMALSISLQLLALWRSLQLKDDEPREYNKTLRWFLTSAIVLMGALVCSFLSYTHILRF